MFIIKQKIEHQIKDRKKQNKINNKKNIRRAKREKRLRLKLNMRCVRKGGEGKSQVDDHVSEDHIEEIVEVVESTGIQEFNESWGRLNHIKKTTTNSNYFLNIDAAIAFHSLVF